MAISWTEKTVPLKDLKPYERNPRKISKEAFNHLKRSMSEDGYHGRLLCTPGLKVIGGHQRLKVMKELGWKDCAVLMPDRDLTEDEYRRLLVRDNLQAGEWDMDMLASDFEPEELLDWGFPENLMPKQEGVVNEPEGDEDDAPEAPDVPQTIRGDLYEIGPHRLLCGDSTLIDDVDKLMGGAKADMVFTDPPYGMRAVSKSGVLKEKYGTDILNDDTIDVARDSFALCNALGVPKQIWWGANYYSNHLPPSACWLVWDKNNGGSDQMDAELAWTNLKGVTRQFTKASEKSNRVHPTQKPCALIEWVFSRFEAGQHILDLFGGSGSTMVAAHKLGRTAYLMELDEKYCDVIVQRMHKLFPDLPIKRNGEPFSVEKTADA